MSSIELKYKLVIEEYGLSKELINYGKYFTIIESIMLSPGMLTDEDRIIFVIANTLLAYLYSCPSLATTPIGGLGLDIKNIGGFDNVLGEKGISLDKICSRRVFYFDRAQIAVIKKYSQALACNLATISNVDDDLALCLLERTKCRDLVNVIVEAIMMIRNLMYA